MRTRMWMLGVTMLAVVGVAPSGSASELRFSQTAAGGIVAAGNTLGLSKGLDENGPGTEDSIGTFCSLDPQSVDDAPANPGNPWFAGTTGDWMQNGSDAQLSLSSEAQVLYAELIWGGSTFYGSEDVTGELDTPVTLGYEADSIQVMPAAVTALDIQEQSAEGFAVNYYMRSADVTDFVDEHGSGMYVVSGVPATQDFLIDELNAAGWTLVVAYRDSSERVKNLTIFVGGSFVDEDSIEDYDFAGFCTPPSGDFDGGVAISAIEGDADRVGDRIAIAETVMDPFASLSGPNNPQDNFFCSQLNGPDGMLDQTGTFGDRNHDAIGGTNVSGGRQSWDVTEVEISSTQGHLDNGQTSAVVRTETTGDSYVPTLVAFEIEVNAPDFGDGTGAQPDPDAIGLQQTSTVTVNMENVGPVAAENLVFTAPLPSGLELDSFAIDGNDGDIDGNAVTAAMLGTGVNVGDVAVDGGTKLLELVVRSVAAPAGDDYVINPGWTYDYVMCVGEPPLNEPYLSDAVIIAFVPDAGTTSDSDDAGDTTSVSATDSDSAGDASTTGLDTGASATDTAGRGDDSGCGCRPARPVGGWAFGLLALLVLSRRRQPTK